MNERMMNSDLPFPRWQGCYRDALIELDQEKLKERVRDAERAIVDRMEVLSLSRESAMELRAIEDALANLRCLKRETLGYSDRSKSGLYSRPSSKTRNEAQGE